MPTPPTTVWSMYWPHMWNIYHTAANEHGKLRIRCCIEFILLCSKYCNAPASTNASTLALVCEMCTKQLCMSLESCILQAQLALLCGISTSSCNWCVARCTSTVMSDPYYDALEYYNAPASTNICALALLCEMSTCRTAAYEPCQLYICSTVISNTYYDALEIL
jgi:hypothetical protein